MPIITVSSGLSNVDMLLQSGVSTLKQLGYLSVDEKTIFTDAMCSALFLRLLEQTKLDARRSDIITACDSLIEKIKKTGS